MKMELELKGREMGQWVSGFINGEIIMGWVGWVEERVRLEWSESFHTDSSLN